MARLLENDEIPGFSLQRCLSFRAQFCAGIELLCQPRPAPGVGHHLRPGEPGQPLGKIIGGGKAVAQHQNAHGFSLVSSGNATSRERHPTTHSSLTRYRHTPKCWFCRSINAAGILVRHFLLKAVVPK